MNDDHLEPSEASRARLAGGTHRGALAVSITSLALSMIIAILLVPALAARSAAPVAAQVVAEDKAKESTAHDAEQDQAIEKLASTNADRAVKGLPPLVIPKDVQDSVINATVARVLATLPQGTQLTAAETARIAAEAADIAQGRIIIPKPADIIPCLSQASGCKGEPGIAGKDGTAGHDGVDGRQGAQGIGVTGIRKARDGQGICTVFFALTNPADGSTSELAVAAPDGFCDPASPPSTTPSTIVSLLPRPR